MTRLAGLLFGVLLLLFPQNASAAQVHALKITVLSTMLADPGLGEWGYSALVEVDGHKILFDTGAHPDVVLQNAASLGVDLSQVEDVVISHNHWDHVGGLVTLRRELMKKNPAAMSRVHVSSNVFLPRLLPDGKDANGLNRVRAEYEALGGHFVLHQAAAEIAPGVWFTGPVPRVTAERNFDGAAHIVTGAGSVEDNVPDDAALVFATADGSVILTGCGHAGIINLAKDANALTANAPLLAVVGGLHLFAKDDPTVDWTGAQLRAMGVKYLLAGHCTGIEATNRLRAAIGLTRRTAPVSAVGSSFTLGSGIQPGKLAA